MGIYSIKPVFQRSLRGVEDRLVAWHVHPDVLTLAALALALLGGALLFFAASLPRWLLVLVPFVALGRTALNALDGLVARRTGLARPWGEVLNEACDRLADIALFGGLAYAPYSNIYLGAATLTAMLFSSYLGVLSKAAGGPREYAGIMAKADRMIVLALGAVVAFILNDLGILSYLQAIVLAGVVVTSIQRLVRIHGHLAGKST
jgi:CDP-diacylglycerol--glycerol-3-phosphate 3-phosphatidyltransferase